jgi:hypothetical protein
MNEAQIRERLQQAVGEAKYPTYLSSRVDGRLKHHDPEQSLWVVGIRRTGSLVALLLVVLLIAALVAVVHLLPDALNPRPIPAVQDPAIQQYQAMLNANDQREQSLSFPNSCLTVADPGCPAVISLWHAADQAWLHDLDLSQPPARFATLAALMHRHLTRAVSYDIAMVTAYKAKDQKGLRTAVAAATAEIDTTSMQAEDIIASSQATTATYTGEVRLDSAYLHACAFCQRLVNQNQASCPASQTPSCSDEIAAFRIQVEIFQEDLVRHYAPDSLAAKDERLQADLVTVDDELDAMTSAISAGDSVALQASFDGLRQALGRVGSDAANIAGSA